MPGLFNILLILMFKLNVILYLLLDEIMLICESLLKKIDPVLLLLEVTINACVLMFIGLEFVL